MKVYLAGKIREHEKDWRRDIVENVATCDSRPPMGNRYAPGVGRFYQWEGDSNQGLDGVERWTWPLRASTIPDVDITGPFFIEGQGHDGMHGPGLHGMGEYGKWSEPMDLERQGRTVALCREAIKSSDLIYAWLGPQHIASNDQGLPSSWRTAYGTLWELGYASGLGKQVAIASLPGDLSEGSDFREELWFALRLATVTYNGYAPRDGLIRVIDHLSEEALEMLCESPPEKSLYRAARRGGTLKLTPQHKVGRYRLDFAIVNKRVAIEVDGLTYHNGQESFIRDQQRQRDLQAAGWKVIRFAAKEAMDNPQRCLAEIERLIP